MSPRKNDRGQQKLNNHHHIHNDVDRRKDKQETHINIDNRTYEVTDVLTVMKRRDNNRRERSTGQNQTSERRESDTQEDCRDDTLYQFVGDGLQKKEKNIG